MKKNIFFAVFVFVLCSIQTSWAQQPYEYGRQSDNDDSYRDHHEYYQAAHQGNYNNGYSRSYNSNYQSANDDYNNNTNTYQNNCNNIAYCNQTRSYYNSPSYGYRHHYRRPCNYYPAAPVAIYPYRRGYAAQPMHYRPSVNVSIRF